MIPHPGFPNPCRSMLHIPDPADDVADEPVAGVLLGVQAVRHCRSCWRQDLHQPVVIRPFLLGFLIVASLGLVLLLRPGRCSCCGHLKLF